MPFVDVVACAHSLACAIATTSMNDAATNATPTPPSLSQLLNFLVHGAARSATYCVLGRTLSLFAPLVKLCDFGSAVVAPQPGTAIEELMTVENTPADWFWRSDAGLGAGLPAHGPGADVWGLGLCFVHLLMGEMPYEEHLEVLRCPPLLTVRLERAWRAAADGAAGACAFGAVSSTAEEGEEQVELMADTLYRVLVLLGPSPLEGCGPPDASCALRSEVLAALSAESEHADQYSADVAQFSLDEGALPALARARARLARVPGGRALLRGLLCLDEACRPSTRDVMRSPVFDALALL